MLVFFKVFVHTYFSHFFFEKKETQNFNLLVFNSTAMDLHVRASVVLWTTAFVFFVGGCSYYLKGGDSNSGKPQHGRR